MLSNAPILRFCKILSMKCIVGSYDVPGTIAIPNKKANNTLYFYS